MSDAKTLSGLHLVSLPGKPRLFAVRPKPCFPWRAILRSPVQLLYYFWHTVVPYSEVKAPPMRMADFPTNDFPSDETVRVFETLHAQAESRGSRLEAKSAALLSTAGIVASVELAVIAFTGAHAWAMALLLASITLLVLSMLAGYRALYVGRSSAMWIGAALDGDCRENVDVKKRYALNMLNSALVSEARNDHIADFVRSSALFLMLATVALLGTVFVIALV